MPDVRGLNEKTARTALVDAGIPADRLTVEVTATIPVGEYSQTGAALPDGSAVYIANGADGTAQVVEPRVRGVDGSAGVVAGADGL